MSNGGERLERIEHILERVVNSLQEMAARQQYHDEAFERHDAEMNTKPFGKTPVFVRRQII